MILYRVPDIATLGALVHASPLLYRYYCQNREEVYTNTTITQLLCRGVNILSSAKIVEVHSDYHRTRIMGLDGRLITAGTALTALRSQTSSVQKTQKRALKLGLNECSQLLGIVYIYGWEIIQDKVHIFRVLPHSWAKNKSLTLENCLVNYTAPKDHYKDYRDLHSEIIFSGQKKFVSTITKMIRLEKLFRTDLSLQKRARTARNLRYASDHMKELHYVENSPDI